MIFPYVRQPARVQSYALFQPRQIPTWHIFHLTTADLTKSIIFRIRTSTLVQLASANFRAIIRPSTFPIRALKTIKKIFKQKKSQHGHIIRNRPIYYRLVNRTIDALPVIDTTDAKSIFIPFRSDASRPDAPAPATLRVWLQIWISRHFRENRGIPEAHPLPSHILPHRRNTHRGLP